jgi:hypothetical protein
VTIVLELPAWDHTNGMTAIHAVVDVLGRLDRDGLRPLSHDHRRRRTTDNLSTGGDNARTRGDTLSINRPGRECRRCPQPERRATGGHEPLGDGPVKHDEGAGPKVAEGRPAWS